MSLPENDVVSIDLKEPVWNRVFTIAPLIVVGTKEGDHYNFAPKHMAAPIGWDNYFAFVCTQRHSTYRNVRDSGFFTVSFPKPSQVVAAGEAAEPRRGVERRKPAMEEMPTFRANKIDGVFLADAYLFLECKMERIIDGFGKYSIIVGHVAAAHVDAAYARRSETEDADVIARAPLLAYLSPGRYGVVRETAPFPFPVGYEP